MSHAFDTPKDSKPNNNFKKKWFAAHQSIVVGECLDQTIRSIQTLENNSIFSNDMIVVYNIKEFKPLYVSSNVEKILGYTQQEYLSWEVGAFLKIGAFNQPDYYDNILKYIEHFKSRCSYSKANTKGRWHSCGISYQHKDGSVKRFLARQELVFNQDYIYPEIGIIYYEDVTHLVKENGYWILFESFESEKRYSTFYRKDGIDKDPITAREKEILLLIADGKSTKEVAAQLRISPDTVGQHRKNMIKRLMAKDTSSLIQMCKICGII